jgi:hypothetical protein
MKTIKFLRGALILLGILLSACAPSANPSAPANVGGGKALSDVIFAGVIESMNGDQWVISGQSVTVDPSVVRDGPFGVGDTVKVEAQVAADGSVIVQRVETPSAADAVEAATSTPDDSSSLPAVPAPSNPQSPVFDDGGNEAVGPVEAITDTSVTIGGQTYTFTPGAEIKGEILPGAVVKLHFITNADGTLSVREIEIADPTQLSDDNQGDDINDDVNDDHGNDGTSGGSHGSDDSNDDHGGSSDDSTDDNSSDGGGHG